MKTLMVVSGGDAPGINALLHQFTRLAQEKNAVVVGAVGGFEGLLAGNITALSLQVLAPFVGQAGSYLASSRNPVLAHPDALHQLRQIIKSHHIDNMVLFGGDGTLRHIPPLLEQADIPYVSIPTTIDNDVAGTERTLGFDSACNYAYQAIDGVLATARALPGRIFLLETLGGHTGFLALAVAYGAGAHAALLPEYEYDNTWLAERVLNGIRRDGHALVVYSEGIPTKPKLALELSARTGIRTRETRLGHAQRGGAPSHLDRTLAAEMAFTAHQVLADGLGSGMVVVENGKVLFRNGIMTDYPTPQPDRMLYNRINGL